MFFGDILKNNLTSGTFYVIFDTMTNSSGKKYTILCCAAFFKAAFFYGQQDMLFINVQVCIITVMGL